MKNGTIPRPKYEGYIFVPEKIEDKILGSSNSLVQQVLRPNGNWLDDLPIEEPQEKNGVETYNCTGFNTNSALEILMFAKGLGSFNFSDRALGINAGTHPPGNSPQTVADAIRHKGEISEDELPFDNSIKTPDEYFSPNPLPFSLVKEGQDWVSEWDFGYEWVYPSSLPISYKQNALKEALKYSPVGISVFAWIEQNGLFVRPEGVSDSHWTVCVGFKEGKWWEIYDSYFPFRKRLAWNAIGKQAMRYHIKKRKNPIGFWQKFLSYLTRHYS